VARAHSSRPQPLGGPVHPQTLFAAGADPIPVAGSPSLAPFSVWAPIFVDSDRRRSRVDRQLQWRGGPCVRERHWCIAPTC
jgi:hypothetical protein